MVKNLGGKRTKGQGRKYVGTNQQRKIRYAVEEGEIYGVVTKLFGGDNCEVVCSDGITRLCIIRKKFRGRGKRDNTVSPGVWILVGLRDWQSANKLEKCDLLEVYSQSDKDALKNNSSLNLTALIKALEDNDDDNCIDNVLFVDDKQSLYSETIQNETTQLVSTILDDDDNSVIDLDDI